MWLCATNEMLILMFRYGVPSLVYMVRKFFEDFGATIQARFLTLILIILFSFVHFYFFLIFIPLDDENDMFKF